MQFPGPVRAVVGLVANATEEAKHLPDRAIELPMLAVSTALQISLRAQQRYARLAARGDEVLNRRRPGDEPPAWATFDDPPPAGDQPAAPADRARAAGDLLDELLGGADPDTEEPSPAPTRPPAKKVSRAATTTRTAHAPATPAQPTPAQPTPAQPTAAKKAAAKKSAAAKKTVAKTTTDDVAKGKTVSKPRHTPPSRFDAVDDE